MIKSFEEIKRKIKSAKFEEVSNLDVIIIPETKLKYLDKSYTHIWVGEISQYHKFLIVSDGMINKGDGIENQLLIIKNAVKLAKSLEIKVPKIALLSAMENVSISLPVSCEQAVISKMAQRKQLGEIIIDGPVALDIAISKKAGLLKNVKSGISGETDILICPHIELGNSLIHALEIFTKCKHGSLILSEKKPIFLCFSEHENSSARINSLSLANLVLK